MRSPGQGPGAAFVEPGRLVLKAGPALLDALPRTWTGPPRRYRTPSQTPPCPAPRHSLRSPCRSSGAPPSLRRRSRCVSRPPPPLPRRRLTRPPRRPVRRRPGHARGLHARQRRHDLRLHHRRLRRRRPPPGRPPHRGRQDGAAAGEGTPVERPLGRQHEAQVARGHQPHPLRRPGPVQPDLARLGRRGLHRHRPDGGLVRVPRGAPLLVRASRTD